MLPETFLDASSQLRVACAARGGRPASSFSAGGRGGCRRPRRTAGRQSIRAAAGAADRHRIADDIDSETITSGQTDHGGRNSTTGPRLPPPHVPGIAGWRQQQDLSGKSASPSSSRAEKPPLQSGAKRRGARDILGGMTNL